MKAIRILGLAAAVAAVVFLPSTLPASAQPIAGSYYAGQITGCADLPCGTVHFKVSGDGLLVQEFTAYDVPGHKPGGGDCKYVGAQIYPFDLDIVDDSFGSDDLPFYKVSGSFPSEGSAQGTLRLSMGDPLCDTGVLNWTAIRSSLVGGIAVLPDVSDSSVSSYIPLVGLAAAALIALTAGGWQARRRRLR